MEYTSTNVEQAVQQFYCNASLQQEAHKWLTSAQISPAAWTFCWDLMAPDKGVEVQFFGASCLHVKISRYWGEITEEQHEGLKNKILEKVIQYSGGPKMVLTRISVALASYILQTLADKWPDPIHDLIVLFQQEDIPNLDSVKRCQALLELLTVIPEEFFSTNLTQYRRGVLRNELTKGLSQILPLLQSLMTPNSPGQVYEHALKCMSSWVEFGIPLIKGEQVILQVFQALDNEELFDTAIDTLVNVFSHQDSQRYPFAIQKLLPNVLRLDSMLKKACENTERETAHEICRLVVSVAETHTKLIVDTILGGSDEQKNNMLTLIRMVLGCTAIPGHYPVDENCSDLTFTFWYVLQDDLLGLEPENWKALLPVFQPLYFSLIEMLLVKVQYPTDAEQQSWSSEEKEQFRCYRQDIGDSMMYAYNILREPLLGHLSSVLTAIVRNGEEVRWQLIEAIFFLFGSVAESVDLGESTSMPVLLNLLPHIPFNHIKLISTALYMIGSFGEWINCHPENLNCVIPLLLQGLENSEVAMAATMALKDITRETLDHIHPYADQILTCSKRVLESNALKAKDSGRLMSCVGQVLSVMPFENILQYLNSILTPHLEHLDRLAKQEPLPATKNDILLKLNMLSLLFASLDTDRDYGDEPELDKKSPSLPSGQPKPVFVILQKVSPILKEILTKWMADEGVVEAICDLYKRSLRTLMDDFAPMSQEVAQLVVQMYRTIPHSSVVDLARQMIVMFSADPEFTPFIQVLLVAICDRTLELFQRDVKEHTDIVEAFMTLLAQVLKKTKKSVTDGGCNIKGIFHAGIIGMSLPEHLTVKSACSFLCEFMLVSQEMPQLKQVVESEGEMLLDRILRAIGGESPRGVTENIADVLLALTKSELDKIGKWLSQAVEKDGYPTLRVTKSEKANFREAVLRARVNKRQIRETVKEFTLVCRGLYGTEYAAQAATMI